MANEPNGYILVSFWQDKSNSGSGSYDYEHFADVRDAINAYEDYVRGEYSRAREVAIVAAHNGIPTGHRINPYGQPMRSTPTMARTFEEAVAKGLLDETAGEGEI